MSDIKRLIENNKRWSAATTKADPEFFNKLAKRQRPEYLWIGCSDSRVPANQIVDLIPGDIFVHRNVANLVVHTDFNCLSVLQYAVDVLKVKHVIVCGHYGCGGIEAALGDQQLGLIDNWLGHIRDLVTKHQNVLDKLTGRAKAEKLCELNVIEQAQNVRRNTIVREAIKRGQPLEVHSWIYRLDSGQISVLDK